jgi:hypothetical protein
LLLTTFYGDRFEPFVDNEEDNYNCHDNAAVFLIAAYQFIILSVTYSKGAPFRKSIFSNCECCYLVKFHLVSHPSNLHLFFIRVFVCVCVCVVALNLVNFIC